ncbi:MAG: DNA-binding protein WhiA [Microbacteriaceae bacterium]|nr:DNA-binding protein WhiA [Microbacteriaceae bacterium]
MALTGELKVELVSLPLGSFDERVGEITGLLRFAGGLHVISGRIAIEAEVETPEIAKRLALDLAQLYNVKAEIAHSGSSTGRKGEKFLVRVQGAEILARQIGLLDSRNLSIRGVPAQVVNGPISQTAALWRGAILAHGTLSDPGRSSASLEVSCPTSESAMALVGAARRLGAVAKAKEVRQIHRVVIREGESISAILGAIGSVKVLSNWNELKQRREVRAKANRLVNFDDANLRRSAAAAVAACARVERALEILGDEVPDHLKYAGELRITHRDSSLDELGQKANPVMTKDAIAGRIRRLLAMADKKAADLGIPNTEASVPLDFDLN